VSLIPDPAAASDLSGERASRALVALAWINTQLASARGLEPNVERTLAHLREVLGADEVAVWLHTPQGLIEGWASGSAGTAEAAVRTALSGGEPGGPRDGVAAMPIVRGDRRVGGLVWRTRRPLTAEERILMTAVAGLLALELTHAERSRRLEVEVAARTEEIERGRRFTEKIIDSLPIGLYVIDREYRIQSWNRRRETGIQATSREAAVGRSIFEVLHLAPDDPIHQEFDEVFRTGRLLEYLREVATTGEPRTFRVTKIPMRLGGGDVTHVITLGEDITDWTQAQARVSQAEKLAAIGQLVAGVMHEVNNPLATIAACAESLGYRIDPLIAKGLPEAQEAIDYLGIIGNEVERCKHIVDGLLDFSRPRPVRRERVQPNEVVERTLFLLKHHARFRKITVVSILDPSVERVPQASAEQLVQVVMGLLLNAMDAMGGTGTVRVVTRVGPSTAEGVIIEVIDEGVGIPLRERDRIFEPFYTTKAPGSGTGLGLSVAYAIIKEHGGRIEVDSVVGEGSTFRIILPVVAA
jgi:two-component system NtrC family sensor kinase